MRCASVRREQSEAAGPAPRFHGACLFSQPPAFKRSATGRKTQYQRNAPDLRFGLRKRNDRLLCHLVSAHRSPGNLPHVHVGQTSTHRLVGLLLPIHGCCCMVCAFRLRLNSVPIQFCCRGVLDCRPFGSASVGAVADVWNGKRTDQVHVLLADLPANSGCGSHASGNANTSRMRREQNKQQEAGFAQTSEPQLWR